MSNSGTYKFKCLDEDNFILTLSMSIKSRIFNMFWRKAVKKLRKNNVDVDSDFIDKIDAIDSKTGGVPRELMIMFEGKSRRKVKKILEGVSSRSGLVFYDWKADNMIYEKQDDKTWDVTAVFKGTYAKRS